MHCKALVAHNMASDIKTINKELDRNGFTTLTANTICTMSTTKRFCNLQNKAGRLKNPKLDELHHILFNTDVDFTRTHNSCYDVEICAKCYFEILRQQIHDDTPPLVKPIETSSTTASESDTTDAKQCKHRCAIDATDISTLIGTHKYETNIFKLVMKYWERGYADDYYAYTAELLGEKYEDYETADDVITAVVNDNNMTTEIESTQQVDELVKQISIVCDTAKAEQAVIETLQQISGVCDNISEDDSDEELCSQIKDICEASQSHTVIDEIKELCSNTEQTQESIVEQVKKTCKNIKQKPETKRIATLTPSDVESYGCKQLGVKLEKTAIEQYQEQYNVKVNELRKYIKKEFYETEISKWFIGGRVDGMIGIDKVLEVKNRRKCLYNFIPSYEHVQISTYMYVLGVPRGVWLQKYQNTIKAEDVDLNIWWYKHFVLRKLERFCNFMDRFVQNEELKEKFVRTNPTDEEQVNLHNAMVKQELGL